MFGRRAFELNKKLRLADDVHEIQKRWRTELAIDVSRFFVGIDRLELHHDTESGLDLFSPSIVGDEALYAELQKIPWYYLEEKWEYEVALDRLPMHAKILEVGCGKGAFLEKATAAGHECVGLELNASAAENACRLGLYVRTEQLSAFLANKANKGSGFDRVLSFQVLEHVLDPVRQIRDMMAATNDGGRVCFAVPNADSFISWASNILDMPPHHVSLWRPDAIRRIGRLVGAREVVVREGPLEPIHFDWFLLLLRGRLRGGRLLKNRYTIGAIRMALDGGLARIIRGHAVYAEYVK